MIMNIIMRKPPDVKVVQKMLQDITPSFGNVKVVKKHTPTIAHQASVFVGQEHTLFRAKNNVALVQPQHRSIMKKNRNVRAVLTKLSTTKCQNHVFKKSVRKESTMIMLRKSVKSAPAIIQRIM